MSIGCRKSPLNMYARSLSPRPKWRLRCLPDDDDSLKLCQIFYEDFGITRQIARLNTFNLVEQFRELGRACVGSGECDGAPAGQLRARAPIGGDGL